MGAGRATILHVFTRKTITFLKDLENNNNRDWFEANKQRYQEDALEPFREFIRAMEPRLHKLSPHIMASDKKVGGAMMRLQRDVRFSKDKTPYDPRLAARFMHARGKKGGTPGYYIKIDARSCTVGTGIWKPDTKFVGRIRNHIVAEPAAWKSATNSKTFRGAFNELGGESLKRAPRGYDAGHPHVEDLMRKDFAAFVEWNTVPILEPDFPASVAHTYAASNQLMAFLCEALGLPF